jgi:hypothetical protein
MDMWVFITCGVVVAVGLAIWLSAGAPPTK